ncbi:hypothetical protein GCM10010528_02330 [Gordonia defluvii]|uniref:Uncharacterized protein n=1 Tax=Gordonia defluvii TaxID=283718 RepID=A0ABP6KZ42_9ACTN
MAKLLAAATSTREVSYAGRGGGDRVAPGGIEAALENGHDGDHRDCRHDCGDHPCEAHDYSLPNPRAEDKLALRTSECVDPFGELTGVQE